MWKLMFVVLPFLSLFSLRILQIFLSWNSCCGYRPYDWMSYCAVFHLIKTFPTKHTMHSHFFAEALIIIIVVLFYASEQ